MTVGSAVPETADLLERVASVSDVVSANAEKNEADRRIADESIRALEEAGLFRLTVPKRFGGEEVDMRTKLEVESAVAGADGSTGWVLNLINVCNWVAGLLPDQAQQEIFGDDPNAKIAGVLAPSAESIREDGGLRVTGSWPWASGSLHATWALVGIPVVDEAGEQVDQGLAVIPRDELTLEDTWFVAGMRGTGSNTLVAKDVFIPDHRILSVPAAIEGDYPTEHTDEAAYRAAFIPVLSLVLVGPVLGLGRAARDLVIEKAPRRAVSYTKFERQSDSTAFQVELAQAAMRVDTAHLHAFRAAADIDSHARRGEKMPYELRARVRADSGYAAAQAIEAIQLLLNAHGASSFAQSSAMQRIWRDANTGGRHAILNSLVNSELYGKALVGVEYEEQISALI
jgi:alkylation response protein AidB-like acyl-CoA dehydrogenase